MRILVAINSYNEDARSSSFVLQAYVDALGIDCDTVSSAQLHASSTLSDLVAGATAADYDLAVALGGDGTVLRVSHLFAGYPVPILGINFGTMGFLANSSEPGVIRMVEQTLAGEAVFEQRTNIEADVFCMGDDGADADSGIMESSRPRLVALNEVALNRGSYGCLIDYDLMIAGDRLASLRADGVVVSTATGSTGYALSAGGPVVAPGYRGLLAIPIAPHTLRTRAIVSAPGDVIEVLMKPMRDGSSAVLAIDGEALEFDAPVSRVIVRTGEVPTTLVRYKQESFYQRVSRYFF